MKLKDRLGHGGMATVYGARDLKLDRDVAIKLLADNFAGDDEVRKRFSREARLAAKLDHPNIVQVFDVGEEDGRPYIVMERSMTAPSLTAWKVGVDRFPARRGSACSASCALGSATPTRGGSSTATSSPRTCCCAPPTAA